MSHNDSAVRREQMAEQQLALRGIVSPLVLDAMRQVPREAFLPGHLWEFAYEDSPLPIDAGQTISQPYIVALMTQALQLKGGETVLEVGTGSGYAAAILSRIAGRVYTVERLATLADKARTALADGGYDNVEVRTGDGTLGWPERAPYDAIIVAAGGPAVPPALKTQLKVGGRLVIPVGSDRSLQELVRMNPAIHVAQMRRNWSASRAFRGTNTCRRISPTCISCRWWARRAGNHRTSNVRRCNPRCARHARRSAAWPRRSPQAANRSTRSTRPIWPRCCGGSVMHAWY